MTIHEIINRDISVDPPQTPQKPKLIKIENLLSLPERQNLPLAFERSSLNYFFLSEHKKNLGIKDVYQLKASRVDGLLELDTGQIVLLEIKYALGWLKCCQARIQFQWFMKKRVYEQFSIRKPENALIVFHNFSGDWARTKNGDKEIGWDNFYNEENDLKDLNENLVKIDVLQLKSDEFFTVSSNEKLVAYS
jgi:hypothetical protein